jgi:nucleotide-binding universal stress UspA family protein
MDQALDAHLMLTASSPMREPIDIRGRTKENTMVSTILVPLDGSDLSRRALPFATALAQATGARLVLLHAYQPKSPDPQADLELDLIQEQADLASGLRERGVHATTWLSYAEPGPAIVETGADLNADVIVMSTHGRGGVGQMMYGSVAEYVARHSTVPVILVTAKLRSRWLEEQPLRLLVPLDGLEPAEGALGPASELAHALHASILLLRVVEPTADPVMLWEPHGSLKQHARDEARRYLDLAAEQLRSDGHQVETRVETGSPPDAIARVADELGTCLVVMATHGRGPLSRLLLESVAAETLRKLAVPVYLVRSGARSHRLPRAGAAVSNTTALH